MFNKDKIAKLKYDVDDLKYKLHEAEVQQTKYRELALRTYNVLVPVDITAVFMDWDWKLSKFLDDVVKQRKEEAELAELSAKVEAILIQKGLLSKPKEKK